MTLNRYAVGIAGEDIKLGDVCQYNPSNGMLVKFRPENKDINSRKWLDPEESCISEEIELLGLLRRIAHTLDRIDANIYSLNRVHGTNNAKRNDSNG